MLRVDAVTKKTEGDCDFCNYKTMTGLESFGRLENEHAVTGTISPLRHPSAHASGAVPNSLTFTSIRNDDNLL